ncbi:hypothetical protein GS446_16935 [Rhodococcus hoagii]|nr:hypothetical protein [Prescottella equi]
MLVPTIALFVASDSLASISVTAQQVLMTIYIATASVGVARSFASGTRPISLIFYSFSLTWAGIPVAWQLANQQAAWGDTTLFAYESTVTSALYFHTGAMVAFFVGDVFFRAKQKARNVGMIVRTPARSLQSTIVPTYFPHVYVVLSLALSPLVIKSVGGVGNLFTSRDSMKEQLAAAGVSQAQAGGAIYGIIKIFPGVLALSAVMLFLAYMFAPGVARQSNYRNRTNYLWLAAALGLCVMYLNPFTNSRFISAGAMIGIVIAMWRPVSRRDGLVVALFALVGLQVAYPIANMFRSIDAIQQGPQFDSVGYSGPDYDGFQQIVNSVFFVDSNGYGLGRYIASGVLYFIPRSIWESKSTPASIDVATERGYYFTNLSLPIHAEFFLEFGPLIALLIMCMMGFFWAKLDDSWLNYPGSKAAALVPYIAVAQFAMLRGPVGSLSPIYLSTVALIAIPLFLVGRRGACKSGGGLARIDVIE